MMYTTEFLKRCSYRCENSRTGIAHWGTTREQAERVAIKAGQRGDICRMWLVSPGGDSLACLFRIVIEDADYDEGIPVHAV